MADRETPGWENAGYTQPGCRRFVGNPDGQGRALLQDTTPASPGWAHSGYATPAMRRFRGNPVRPRDEAFVDEQLAASSAG